MRTDGRLLIKYYRLSLEDQDAKESNSIVNQRKLIEDYVEGREDLKSLDSLELSDDGYTGTNFNRPGIRRFFELLKRNKVACLVVKDFSRFTRDYIELGNYAEQIFPFMDVRFISVNDNYDSTFQDSNSSLEVPFKGILNDLYSKDISMKVKAAKRQMIKDGKLSSGSYPFGYRKTEKGKGGKDEALFQVDEEAAEVVRMIFKLALEGKKNIETARELNEKGCPTPGIFKRRNGSFGYGLKDGEISIWDSTKVLIVLRDERYTGTLVVGRYQGMGVGSGKVEKLPEHMWVRKEDGIPAIIPKETFELVQSMRPIRKKGKYRKEHHILYQKVKCGCCGRFLYFKPSDDGEQYNSFFCKQTHLISDSKCFRGYIKEREILDMLTNLVKAQVRTAAAMKKEALQKVRKDEQQDQNRLRRLEKEIELKKGIKAQDYSAYKAGEFTKEEFLERKACLQRTIEMYEQEMQEIHDRIGNDREDTKDFVEKFGEYQEDFQLNREMVEKLVKTIWVYDTERVKIELNNSLSLT